jgi:hypothetical protein
MVRRIAGCRHGTSKGGPPPATSAAARVEASVTEVCVRPRNRFGAVCRASRNDPPAWLQAVKEEPHISKAKDARPRANWRWPKVRALTLNLGQHGTIATQHTWRLLQVVLRRMRHVVGNALGSAGRAAGLPPRSSLTRAAGAGVAGGWAPKHAGRSRVRHPRAVLGVRRLVVCRGRDRRRAYRPCRHGQRMGRARRLRHQRHRQADAGLGCDGAAGLSTATLRRGADRTVTDRGAQAALPDVVQLTHKLAQAEQSAAGWAARYTEEAARVDELATRNVALADQIANLTSLLTACTGAQPRRPAEASSAAALVVRPPSTAAPPEEAGAGPVPRWSIVRGM